MRASSFTFVPLAMAAVAFMITASGPATAGDLDGQSIKVCTWGGTWRDIQRENIVTNPGGLEERGANVDFVAGSPQDSLAKLVAARGAPVCDVVEVLDATWGQMVEADFVVDELDLSLIPNVKYLPDWLVGKNFTGSWLTQEGICYKADKFKEHGIPAPTTYKDLIHPRLEGLIQLPDITSGGGFANLGGMVKAAGGGESNIQPGLDLITEMKVTKFWKSGSEGVTLLESDDIWVLVGHLGWCMRAYKAGQTNLKFVHPVIDDKYVGVNAFGYLTIVKSSDPKNRDAAHAYINGYLDEETQFQQSNRAGTISANKKAYPRLAQDPILSGMAVLDPAEIAKEYRVDYGKVDVPAWYDQWNRNITR